MRNQSQVSQVFARRATWFGAPRTADFAGLPALDQ
jgi:hypothetical protein